MKIVLLFTLLGMLFTLYIIPIVYGHDLPSDLISDLRKYDIEFSKKIDNRVWELSYPYHGSLSYPCVFGTIISDSDGNKSFLSEIRNSKESEYEDNYRKFLKELFLVVNDDDDIESIINKLKIFISQNQPGFYLVEVSS